MSAHDIVIVAATRTAVGAALLTWHQYLGNPRKADGKNDSQHGSYLGPEFSRDEIHDFLTRQNAPFVELSDKEIPERLADLIKAEKVSIPKIMTQPG